jgi:hypothetical protein
MAANCLSTHASAIQTAAIHRYCGLSLWSTVACVYRGKKAFCDAANGGGEMTLWVTNDRIGMSAPCPLLPRKRPSRCIAPNDTTGRKADIAADNAVRNIYYRRCTFGYISRCVPTYRTFSPQPAKTIRKSSAVFLAPSFCKILAR